MKTRKQFNDAMKSIKQGYKSRIKQNSLANLSVLEHRFRNSIKLK